MNKKFAQEISNSIKITTAFDKYNILQLLNLLNQQKPVYTSFSYLGAGGNSLILKTNLNVALKVMKVNESNLEEILLLQNEHKQLKKLQYCEYIIKIFDDYFIYDDDEENQKQKMFYVIEMEECQGNLHEYLRELKQYNLNFLDELKNRLVIQILDAISVLHQNGICHYDIRPQKFLIKYLQDGIITLKLCDIGMGKVQTLSNNYSFPKSLQHLAIKGKESYMAYEVLNKQYYLESDLFSVGLILIQIDNLQFDYQSVSQIEFYDVQRQLYKEPFESYSKIQRNSLIYEIGKTFLKNNPRERKSAGEFLKILIDEQKKKGQNKEIDIYSLFGSNNLKKILSQIQLFKQQSDFISSSIINLKKYDEFEIISQTTYGITLGAVNIKEKRRKVALQILDSAYSDCQQQMQAYLNIMSENIAPNILHIYDFITFKNNQVEYQLLETERFNISLYQFLQQKRNFGQISESMKIDIAKQILESVNILHSHQITAKNINPNNFQIQLSPGSDKIIMKLSDYCVSHKSLQVKENPQQNESSFYQAPEVYFDQQYSKESDIFSIGIILIQLDNYETFIYPRMQAFQQILSEFEIPFEQNLVINRDSLLYKIAEQCLQYDFKKRKPVSYLLDLLQPENKQQGKTSSQMNLLNQQLPQNQIQELQQSQNFQNQKDQLVQQSQNQLQNKEWNIQYGQLIKALKGDYDFIERVKSQIESQKENYLQRSKIHLDLQPSLLKRVFSFFSSSQDISLDAASSLGRILNTCYLVKDLQLNFYSCGLLQGSFDQFLQEMKQCIHLTKLNIDLSSNNITELQIKTLEAFIKQQTNLSDVEITVDSPIKDQDLKNFIKTASSLQQLKNLILKGNINPKAVNGESLNVLIKSKVHQKKIDIQITNSLFSFKSDNTLINQSANNLEALQININGKIDDADANFIGDAIASSSALKYITLQFDNSELKQKGFGFIGQSLSSLEHLFELKLIIRQFVGDDELIAFSQNFIPNKQLESISMELGRKITEKGFIKFIESLKYYKMVKILKLDFSYNYIHGTGHFPTFGENLSKMAKLTDFQINLSYNHIRDTEVSEIGWSLSQLPSSLRELKIDLSHNCIYDKGLVNFSGRISSLSLCSLVLNLKSLNITDDGVNETLKCLKKQPFTNLEINFEDNNISNKGGSQIPTSLKNSKIVDFKIRLARNKIEKYVQDTMTANCKEVQFYFY